ncbi:response regulator [Winogradskyella sp.]|uniref:response regulator n=1 Tax=Winogradskyella sp. TaxID=1883156 RepID=UPI003BAA0EDF
MSRKINTLIVEDEPLMTERFCAALEEISEADGILDFDVKSSLDCVAAAREIQRSVKATPIDLVLLDINMDPSSDNRYLSGEDLGIEIREFFPNAKIVAFTYHNNNFRLNNTLENLNPDAFLIKKDMSFKILIDALKSVIDDTPYYSKAIIKLMRRHFLNDFKLDRIDRQLLYQLSKGAKMKHLTSVIPLTKPALDLRKRHLKEIFGVAKGDDRDLLIKAEECGFI